MRARRLGLSALALALAALALAGCGGVSGASDATGSELTIYTSLPLHGEWAEASAQIVNGEKLALSQAGGRAGRFRVAFSMLDDSNPSTGMWEPGLAAGNAKTAAQDPSTIAYIGELDSGATAISLPIMNAAGILQVSPSSPYQGLTSSFDAGQFEPERFYPTAKVTFGRLQPGDPVEAAAQVRLMQILGVQSVYVLDDGRPFHEPLAAIVATDAARAGIAVAGHDSISTEAGSVFTGEIEKIVSSGVQAVFLAGEAGPGAAQLWQQLHTADPRLKLLGSSAMAVEAFTSKLGLAAAQTYLTTPLLATGLYPPSAQRVLAQYRRAFAEGAGAWALYGYESMSVVLDTIKSLGGRGNSRPDVVARFLATRRRDSVIGRYSMQANGETTLSTYGVDRVSAGLPVFYRAVYTPAAPAEA